MSNFGGGSFEDRVRRELQQRAEDRTAIAQAAAQARAQAAALREAAQLEQQKRSRLYSQQMSRAKGIAEYALSNGIEPNFPLYHKWGTRRYGRGVASHTPVGALLMSWVVERDLHLNSGPSYAPGEAPGYVAGCAPSRPHGTALGTDGTLWIFEELVEGDVYARRRHIEAKPFGHILGRMGIGEKVNQYHEPNIYSVEEGLSTLAVRAAANAVESGRPFRNF
jgi:hypothetical protein